MEVAAVIPKTSGLSNNEITELLYKIDPNNSDVEVENDDSEADIRDPEPNELLDDLREDEDNVVPEGEITPITPGQAGSSRDPSQRWRHKNEFPVLPEMDQTCSTGISAGSSEIPEVKTPFSYFERYLKDDFFEDMAEFSNRKYVLLKGRSLNTNGPEIRKYWGASIAAALVGFPKIRVCWDRRTRFPLIADNISRDRFYTLRNSLKIVDDNAVSDLKKEDRFWKVRPMLARMDIAENLIYYQREREVQQEHEEESDDAEEEDDDVEQAGSKRKRRATQSLPPKAARIQNAIHMPEMMHNQQKTIPVTQQYPYFLLAILKKMDHTVLLEHYNVHGLLFGVRGIISKYNYTLLKSMGFTFYNIEKMVKESLKDSIQILQVYLYFK
ncbi:hypothetical protein ANN_12674 [Periplaneta americana]|uniref:PiggyBac transposable element-derived protein domain-containing protein n=1 Tax=Periplaneta americana TaxID=6978 RepID=A0ABQ8TI91_PERAM|nr:hypothetical protein ANN_12674 [Periplaneta americana]